MLCLSLLLLLILLFPLRIPLPPLPPIVTPSPSPPPIRKSSRFTSAPSYLKYYICHASSQSSPHSNRAPLYPISDFFFYFHKLSNIRCRFVLYVSTNIEPKSFSEASKYECWNQAVNTELSALERTGTRKLVGLPPNVKPICCRWVYKVKHHVDDSI